MNESLSILSTQLAIFDMDRGQLEDAIRNSSSEERETFVERLDEQGLNLQEGMREINRMIQMFDILIKDGNEELNRLSQKSDLRQRQISVLKNRRDCVRDSVDNQQEMITALQSDSDRLRSQRDETNLMLLHSVQKLEALQHRSDRIQFLMALRNRIQTDKNPRVGDLVLGIRERCSKDAQQALQCIAILTESFYETSNWIYLKYFSNNKIGSAKF